MKRWAFLSVIAWPESASREELAVLLADATGMEPATLRLRIGPSPPLIVAMFEVPVAQRAAAQIDAMGGIAFAPTLDEIEALGPTIKIRDMRFGEGRLHLDLWRSEPISIDPTSIEVIIRGRRSETTIRRDDSVSPLARAPMRRRYAFGAGGAYGIAAGLSLLAGEIESRGTGATRETRLSHMIDLHTREGRVFQIDADKFGFQVLGDQRGHGDLVNTDRLCDMIAALAPGVTVDPYFSLWRPPVELGRVRFPQAALNRDDPAFALYSRWSALLYRYMARRMGE